jgi:hypothetical protein
VDITTEFDFLEKYRLTPTELMTVLTILLAQDGEGSYILRFNNILTKVDIKFRDLLLSLQDKGIVLKSYNTPNTGESIIIKDIPISKTFTSTFYKASNKLGKELFDVYPQMTIVNGSMYALRRISKKFNSLDEAFKAYGRSIKWNPEEHNRIIELVKWGIENNYNFTTLDDFIVDRAWDSIQSMKDGNAINVNFNAVTQL